jgi:hypothetical protein
VAIDNGHGLGSGYVINQRKGRSPKPSAPDAPLVPAENWANVVFAASSTFQTLTWAKANRDTNVIANSLAWADEHSRSSIEALFASAPESVRSKYGSADAFILSLFDYPPPDDSRRAVNFRILSENTVGDEATVLFEEQFADGHTISGHMRYVRIGNEWRQTLDFDEPATGKLSTVLQAQTPAPTVPPDGKQPGGMPRFQTHSLVSRSADNFHGCRKAVPNPSSSGAGARDPHRLRGKL